ncbi:hypothetical protein PCANC_08037 [Puccinia coronata f. sp. avenae]|nr:hypothetical protein PCANC_08037 [Puccinia coronata f. sp. avenae]
MLLKVPSQLILRLKSHFHILPIGIDLIIGVNGWIWIAQQRAQSDADEGLKEGFEAESDNMYSDVNEPISSHTRATIARLAGAINLMSTLSMPISDSSILRTYEASLEISRLSRLDHRSMDVDDSSQDPAHTHQDLDGFLKPEFRDKVLALLVASS